MTRGRLILALLGILLFGLLTFCIGLLVGLRLDRMETGVTQETAQPEETRPAAADATAPDAAAPDAAIPEAGPAPAADAIPPAKGTMEDPPPIIPVGPPPPVVTDVSSAADPLQPLVSPLIGPLAAQAATPVLPPPQPAVPAPPPSTRVLAVQLGRFTRLDSATVFSKRLTEKGYRPQIVMADYPGMPPWYLVTLGPQPDEATARRVAAEMSRVLEVDVIVVSWAAKPAG